MGVGRAGSPVGGAWPVDGIDRLGTLVFFRVGFRDGPLCFVGRLALGDSLGAKSDWLVSSVAIGVAVGLTGADAVGDATGAG